MLGGCLGACLYCLGRLCESNIKEFQGIRIKLIKTVFEFVFVFPCLFGYGGYLSNRARRTEENKGKPKQLRVLILDFLLLSLVLFVFLRFS